LDVVELSKRSRKQERSVKCEYMAHMGDDLLVVNAARASFDKESDWVCVTAHDGTEYTPPKGCDPDELFLSKVDQKLISYLAKHNHWTPFAHPQITLRMSAPVPIRTQCFKHKQGFVENEESRRYIKSTPELYVPNEFRMAAENVKQGSAGKHYSSHLWLDMYQQYSKDTISIYEAMIDDGICPEQARFILPQGCMVNWVWTGSLAAYARFYKQRTDPHAQKEIQQLAEKVGEIIAPLFPVSWKALTQ
jgi:thymidylate synthase (FAD)